MDTKFSRYATSTLAVFRSVPFSGLKYRKLSNLEYYILLINSMLGFFLLCESNDLITAYLAIELQGLAFYVLASFKKSSSFSIESGIKYFI